MMGACLDIPSGSSKSQIGRIVTVEGYTIPVFGDPWLYMANVRSSDMKRTPDIRTRCLIWPWAVRIRVRYVASLLKEQAVTNLLAAGGVMQGVGDGRPEKGKLDFGTYEIADQKDPRFIAASKFGRKEQKAAMAAARPYDEETAKLLAWFSKEAAERGFKGVA
jgi:hypothetical protein